MWAWPPFFHEFLKLLEHSAVVVQKSTYITASLITALNVAFAQITDTQIVQVLTFLVVHFV